MDIPGYRVIEEVGSGGFASVYLAEQISLQRQVALKVLKQLDSEEHEERVSRFLREARLIAGLDHPGIVSIHDFGETGSGELFYAMPFLDHGDLSQLNWTSEDELVGHLAEICDALAHAHDAGVVHRDLKPQNVLLNRLGKPLIADFGIAYAEMGDTQLTQEGQTIGSVYYMSPEQAQGQRVDARSDLYSLGVVMYEMLTGKVPFREDNMVATLLAHVNDPPPSLPAEYARWQPLVHRCLAKRPEDRYPDAVALQQALQALLDAGDATVPHPAAAPTHSVPSSLKRWWVPGAMAAAVLVLGGGWLLLRGNGSPDSPAEPDRPTPTAAETGGVDGGRLESPPTASAAAPEPLRLTAKGYKEKGNKIVELSWSGSSGRNVIINRVRNDRDRASFDTPNDGAHSDRFKPGGRYRYQVCEPDLKRCSDEVTVEF